MLHSLARTVSGRGLGKACVLVLLLFLAEDLSAQEGHNQGQLTLSLRSAKSSFVDGEPMKFWLSIENRSEVAVKVKISTSFFSRQTTILEESDDGNTFRASGLDSFVEWLGVCLFDSAPTFNGSLLPKRRQTWDSMMTWKKKIGEKGGPRYFRAKVLEENSKQVLFSNSVRLELRPCDTTESEAASLFAASEVEKVVYGASDDDTLGKPREALETILSTYSTSVFGPYAKYYLGYMDAKQASHPDKHDGMESWAKAKAESAISRFSDALNGAFDFSLRDDALYEMAKLSKDVLGDSTSEKYYAAQILLQCPDSSHCGYARIVIGEKVDMKSAIEILKKFKQEHGDQVDEETKELAKKLVEYLQSTEEK